VTPDQTLTARWRGAATAALTAALSVAAHAAAGGSLPTGAGGALVGVIAITLGALATTMRGAPSRPVLLALLASGQLLGHILLSSAGHQHSTMAGHGTTAMTIAHVAAVFAGAALIAAAGRLGAALSHAVRAAIAPQRMPVATVPAPAFHGGDQPLRSSLQLAASVSHRGPPVRLAS
jgi:hypothetical protein